MFIAILLELSVVWILGLVMIFHWFFSSSLWEKVQRNVPDGLQLVFAVSWILSLIFVLGSYFISELEFQSNVKGWGLVFGFYIVMSIIGYTVRYIIQARENLRRTKGLY